MDSPPGPRDRDPRRLQPVAIAAMEAHLGAVGGEPLGDPRAQPGARSGDQCALARQRRYHAKSSFTRVSRVADISQRPSTRLYRS
jgi:hypothetical protein